MRFLTPLTLASAIMAAEVAAPRKLELPSLADALTNVDARPPLSTDLFTKSQTTIGSARQLISDLFSDTRQGYQQSLTVDHNVSTEPDPGLIHKKDLAISVVGLGLATAGALLAPIFYLPSVLCTLYAARKHIENAYRIFVEEHRLDYRAVWAMIVPAALAGGFIWASAFASVSTSVSYYLVTKTENRAKQSITDLFGGQIRTVWLLVDGIEVETPVEQVQVGDTVVVQAGQMIPVDGMIISGSATVDQHMLTGEAQPAEKDAGEPILAATMVLSGRLYIRVEEAGNATVAAKIAHMLGQTTDFKRTLQSRTDRWLNRMALPMIGLSLLALPFVGVSGAVAVLWYYPGSRMIFFGPLSMLSYLQVAAQKRILIKDGRALEVLSEVKTVIFDKTGTLTLEQPTVSRIHCGHEFGEEFAGREFTETELLRYAAAAEAKQSHPIAHAILQAAEERGLELPPLEDAQYKIGYGLKTQIDGQTVRVGSVRFMTLEGIAIPPSIVTRQEESHVKGNSFVLVALGSEVAGAIELQPTIRPEASEIIQSLHKRGIETVIISGDNEEPTRRLSAELGIKRYFAEVLPEDKANLVTQLQKEGHKVCFVGDGINDSIALKTADVAVSLRGATTIATDMAQIVFMDGTLVQLLILFELADDFSANMRVNLLAATLPSVVGIAGTFLLGWGMTLCVFLYQANIPVGIYNALRPLLNEHTNQEENS